MAGLFLFLIRQASVLLCCFASSAEFFCPPRTWPAGRTKQTTKTQCCYPHILTNQRTTQQTKPRTMPPRVESFTSLSRSIDSTESVKGGKPFQSFLVGPRDASTATSSTAALPSAELRTMIENQADRRGYVTAPTPIEHMPRLSNLSENGPQLYVKRDDLLPLAGGGSKTRKLDFLVQEALDQGADVLVTSGAVQSNHCRLTASAAAREGMECYVILEERIPGSYNPKAGGNNYAFALLGAKQIPAPLGGVAPVQDDLVAKLKAEGKKPYVIPGGGSNEMGALGYCVAAAEIIEQSHALKEAHGEKEKPGLFWDAIVTCSGSGGTHTGILTGLRAAGIDTPVIGISVRFDAETQGNRICGQVKACIDKYFSDCDAFADGFDDKEVIIHDGHVGEGYSLPTKDMALAIQNFARLESIILDPVYTGKGAAGLLAVASDGSYGPDQRVLFIHTGGAPSLYHYQTLPSDLGE